MSVPVGAQHAAPLQRKLKQIVIAVSKESRPRITNHQSRVTTYQSLFTTQGNFRRSPVHRGAAPLAGRRALAARSGTPRPRTACATGSNKQRAFSQARRAFASPRSERDSHGRIADDGSAAGNHHRRSVVQAGGRNAKTFSRSSGMAASNGGNCRPLQLATRTGETHLSGVCRSGRRDAGFLFGKSESQRRAETLSPINTGSAFAA